MFVACDCDIFNICDEDFWPFNQLSSRNIIFILFLTLFSVILYVDPWLELVFVQYKFFGFLSTIISYLYRISISYLNTRTSFICSIKRYIELYIFVFSFSFLLISGFWGDFLLLNLLLGFFNDLPVFRFRFINNSCLIFIFVTHKLLRCFSWCYIWADHVRPSELWIMIGGFYFSVNVIRGWIIAFSSLCENLILSRKNIQTDSDNRNLFLTNLPFM